MRTFGVLIMGLVALVAGGIGYQIGVTSTADATRVVYVGGGFPGFGTLFFLFLIGLIFFSFAGRRRAWDGGHGRWGRGYGRGSWGGPAGPDSSGGDASTDPRRQWVADMHRSLHEAEARSGGTMGGTTGTQPTNPTSPTDPTSPPTAG